MTLKFAAHDVHLGVKIVEVVEQNRFGNHRQLRRTELQFAMMAQDHVLDQHAERRRKVRQRRQLLLDHRDANGDVPYQLPLQGVVEAGAPAQLLQLADVMQNGAGQKQITVDFGIMLRSQLADADQRDHVLQQTAQPGMVEALGGRSLAKGRGEDRIVEKGAHQRLQGRIGEAVDGLHQRRP